MSHLCTLSSLNRLRAYHLKTASRKVCSRIGPFSEQGRPFVLITKELSLEGRIKLGVSQTKFIRRRPTEIVETPSLAVTDVLDNLRKKLLPPNLTLTQGAVLRGEGRHLGIPIEWVLTLGPKGAFIEKFTNKRFSISWGSVGVPSLECWEVDYTGIVRPLTLDDLESCLLTTWVRSSQWLMPDVLAQLEIDEGKHIDETSEIQREMEKKPDASTVNLSIRLKTGKVKIHLRVDLNTWLPMTLTQDLFGDRETWTYQKWTTFEDIPFLYPSEVNHVAASGGQHRYETLRGHLLGKKQENDVKISIQAPTFTMTPTNTEFDISTSNLIPAWRTPSGHILVKPLVNGREIGFMLLDTGASGLVMEKTAADFLQLEQFGNLFVAGISGKVLAHFRAAKSFVLGPLTIQNPHFMEMSVPVSIAGSCSPIIGIIGYDFFRRCVIEMKSAPSKSKSTSLESNFSLKIFELCSLDQKEVFEDVNWIPIRMITNLPHIYVQFSANGIDVHEGLFMIDTGAGGAFIMFTTRAVQEYNFPSNIENNSKTFVKGVGDEKKRHLAVKNGQLSWVDLGGKRLSNVSCLFLEDSSIDISVYSCGILCMNMLQDRGVVFDYSRNRIAFLEDLY